MVGQQVAAHEAAPGDLIHDRDDLPLDPAEISRVRVAVGPGEGRGRLDPSRAIISRDIDDPTAPVALHDRVEGDEIPRGVPAGVQIASGRAVVARRVIEAAQRTRGSPRQVE